MNNKKSIAIGYLIAMLIGISVFLVVIFIVPNLLGEGSAQASQLISGTGDFDHDAVPNYLDKCACDSGDPELDGCPYGKKYTQEDVKKCKEDIAKSKQK